MSISRRKILKTLGISVGSLVVSQLPVTVAKAKISHREPISGVQQDNQIKAVLIGAGKRGNRIGKFTRLAEKSSLAVCAVADVNTERAGQFSQLFDVPTAQVYADGMTLLQQPRMADVAIITAGSNYVNLCTAALKAGYDVWVDKPVSLDLEEVETVNRLARRGGKTIYIYYRLEKEICFMPHRLLSNEPSVMSSIGELFLV